MPETTKDFYNIAQLTKAFRQWDDRQAGRDQLDIEGAQIWQARAMLAMAQQLSVISAHLGTITKGVKDSVKDPT